MAEQKKNMIKDYLQLESIVNEIQSEMALLHYNVNAAVKVSADASKFGLGAVLFQRDPKINQIRPVSVALKAMNETEKRYAQMEKETLAITWACERFDNFICGRMFEIETDHKPLVPLFSTKRLNEVRSCIQRFHMHLMRYEFSTSHTAGKDMHIADYLSRAPVNGSSELEITT